MLLNFMIIYIYIIVTHQKAVYFTIYNVTSLSYNDILRPCVELWWTSYLKKSVLITSMSTFKSTCYSSTTWDEALITHTHHNTGTHYPSTLVGYLQLRHWDGHKRCIKISRFFFFLPGTVLNCNIVNIVNQQEVHLNWDIILLRCVEGSGRVEFSTVEDGMEGDF